MPGGLYIINDLNSLYAYYTKFFDTMLVTVRVREMTLQRMLDDGSYEPIIKETSMYAGRRPSLHIELGLLDRVKKAGFGNLVRFFPSLQSDEFETELEKSEQKFTERTQFTGSKRKLVAAAARVSQACKFPKEKFKPSSLRDAAENQLNHQSSSGYPRFRRKGLVLEELINQASDVLSNVLDVWHWPTTRGFRLQIRESGPDLKLKIRVMYPYPGVIILLEDTFIMPFVEHFINTDTFYVIGRKGKQIGDLITNKFKGKGRLCGSDISGFDQHMTIEVIILAFGIIRERLELTKIQAKTFDNIVAYYCKSIMISKSGKNPAVAFVKVTGLPSGSGFTNMIGSLCQAIMVEYFTPGMLDNSLICGDDNLFALPKGFSFLGYSHCYANVFNMVVDPTKTKFFQSHNDCFFLGFRWINGVRIISPFLAINQMLWHTDFLTELDTYDRELARSASVLLNGQNGAKYFQKIFPDVMNMLDRGQDVRFTYLYGTQPPSQLPGVTGRLGPTYVRSHVNQSLLLHLGSGWAIR